MSEQHINIGDILIAQPFLLDSNFKRAVIVLCEHDDAQGSMGFIVNKPLSMKLDELVDGFPEFETNVFYGGPVATNSLHYMHDVGELLEESIEIQRGVYWGGNFEKLKFLIEQKLILPKNIKFFIGYSGWSAGQLKNELYSNTWYTGKGDPNYLFNSKPTGLWRQTVHNKGSVYTVLAEIPDSNILN